MTREQKREAIEMLKQNFIKYSNFYVMDTESLTVAQTNDLRKQCFAKHIQMKVAKNTLIKKALNQVSEEKYGAMMDVFHGVSALIFSESPKDPALLLASFRSVQKTEKPVLKAAFIDGDVFMGDHQLAVLTHMKTKNELVAELIGMLQSPINSLLSGLQNSASHRIVNLLKSLEQR